MHIVEIEAIINSHPLTFLNLDDTEEPLTPSHLLMGHRILSLPDNFTYFAPEDEDLEVTNELLQRRAKHLNSVFNHFWKWWSKEYLLELRDIHQCLQAYGFIRILYGIALENTEYGESDVIYGYAFWSSSKNGRQRMYLMCQPESESK